jgi:hypothetical protein
MTRNAQGWRNESYRHSLSSKGLTSTPSSSFMYFSEKQDKLDHQKQILINHLAALKVQREQAYKEGHSVQEDNISQKIQTVEQAIGLLEDAGDGR